MINETILLLVYYYDYEMPNYILLKDWIDSCYFPFDRYIYQPLQKIFSRAVLYNYLERMTEVGIKAVNEEIVDLVKKEHPKYVLWISFYYDVQPSTLEIIREEGSIVVGWFFDDEWRFDNYSKWWIPYLDYCVTNAAEAVPKYQELGARVIQTTPNSGIAIDHDWSKIEEKYDVSFVGSPRADREHYINEIRKRNIDIYTFGLGWGGYVSFEEMIDIFRTSKINLNFSKDRIGTKLQIKGRIFEVCLAGGFLLTECFPGIKNYFEIDKEIACFENAQDMVNKIIYYLNHDEERRTIAQAGWQRATGEYTSFHFISRVFREIEEDLAVRDKQNNPNVPKLKMPLSIRLGVADYHFEWGRVLLEENYKGLWKDELALSIFYYPFKFAVWYYFLIGFLPFFMRPPLLKFYKTYIIAMERLYMRLRHKLLCWADSIPYLRDIKRSVAKRFYHT